MSTIGVQRFHRWSSCASYLFPIYSLCFSRCVLFVFYFFRLSLGCFPIVVVFILATHYNVRSIVFTSWNASICLYSLCVFFVCVVVLLSYVCSYCVPMIAFRLSWKKRVSMVVLFCPKVLFRRHQQFCASDQHEIGLQKCLFLICLNVFGCSTPMPYFATGRNRPHTSCQMTVLFSLERTNSIQKQEALDMVRSSRRAFLWLYLGI